MVGAIPLARVGAIVLTRVGAIVGSLSVRSRFDGRCDPAMRGSVRSF
jgi:hypothetical protein